MLRWKIKVSGKVADLVFEGSMWNLEGKKLEVMRTSEDGVVECDDENGELVTLNVNDFVKGKYLGNKYADYENPDSID